MENMVNPERRTLGLTPVSFHHFKVQVRKTPLME
jgi:hypothetical protein